MRNFSRNTLKRFVKIAFDNIPNSEINNAIHINKFRGVRNKLFLNIFQSYEKHTS